MVSRKKLLLAAFLWRTDYVIQESVSYLEIHILLKVFFETDASTSTILLKRTPSYDSEKKQLLPWVITKIFKRWAIIKERK